MKEDVRVTCDGTDLVPLSKLKSLQGGLKSLSKDSYKKLRESILRYGISFPFLAWKDEDGDLWILDGTQRARALRRMRKEGYNVPPVPLSYVSAEDEREAKRKILLANNRHGKLTDENLYFFLEENQLLDGLDLLDLPEFSIEKFIEGWIEDTPPSSPKADPAARTVRGPARVIIYEDGEPQEPIEVSEQGMILIERKA